MVEPKKACVAAEFRMVDLTGVSLAQLRTLDGPAFDEAMRHLLREVDDPQQVLSAVKLYFDGCKLPQP